MSPRPQHRGLVAGPKSRHDRGPPPSITTDSGLTMAPRGEHGSSRSVNATPSFSIVGPDPPRTATRATGKRLEVRPYDSPARPVRINALAVFVLDLDEAIRRGLRQRPLGMPRPVCPDPRVAPIALEAVATTVREWVATTQPPAPIRRSRAIASTGSSVRSSRALVAPRSGCRTLAGLQPRGLGSPTRRASAASFARQMKVEPRQCSRSFGRGNRGRGAGRRDRSRQGLS